MANLNALETNSITPTSEEKAAKDTKAEKESWLIKEIKETDPVRVLYWCFALGILGGFVGGAFNIDDMSNFFESVADVVNTVLTTLP